MDAKYKPAPYNPFPISFMKPFSGKLRMETSNAAATNPNVVPNTEGPAADMQKHVEPRRPLSFGSSSAVRRQSHGSRVRLIPLRELLL